MTIRANEMKSVMQRGALATSFSVNRWRSVDAAEIAKLAGFEWLFLDLEHSVLSEEAASQMAIMALSVGITPVARVGMDQFYQAARLLDGGIQGIIFPHVDTPAQATAAARATKYPPLGARSVTGPLPQASFVRSGDPASLAALNEQTLTIVMLETETAIRNAAAIAAVDGVDAVMIGVNDLAAELGIAGQLAHPRIQAAYAEAGKAARAAGKFFGMGGAYTRELVETYLEHGIQFMLGGPDISFVIDGAKARRAMLAELDAARKSRPRQEA